MSGWIVSTPSGSCGANSKARILHWPTHGRHLVATKSTGGNSMKSMAICVASWGANRLDIFGLGTDNQMYHKAWDGSSWLPSEKGWDLIGGVFNSLPGGCVLGCKPSRHCWPG